MKPKILDLFCGAGGGATGYHRAGFDVVGVDIKPQPRYPFPFLQQEALWILDVLQGQGSVFPSDGKRYWLCDFNVIHASPPCQAFSIGTICRGKHRGKHPDLLTTTLAKLQQIEIPWVVENVPRAPMAGSYAVELCGLTFGLRIFRHRLFASSHLLFSPQHKSHRVHRIGERGMVCVAGHGGQSSGFGNRARRVPADHRTKDAWSRGIGIDWMTRDELAQAIPPAYTEFIGKQLIRIIS